MSDTCKTGDAAWRKEDFDYFLPKELIAQVPTEPRDNSRLMILGRTNSQIEHTKFHNIVNYLNPGDCLVLNQSKVLPARIFGIKSSSGAKVEFLLLSQIEKNVWKALAKPGKRAKIGSEFSFYQGERKLLEATVEDISQTGERIIRFKECVDFYQSLDTIGQMPIPPYIKEKLQNKQRYQTVYAKDLGSAAAPTAGLHFTDELLRKIQAKGVSLAFITLHVGLGTFRPVKESNIKEHKMHYEHYSIPQKAVDIITETKKNGKKVIAVGTTSCRTLEAAASTNGELQVTTGDTDIFIHPGYNFKLIDGLVTNFHLPESTLIMLVCAFAGYENTMKAYSEAVKLNYKFFSFGDAMMII